MISWLKLHPGRVFGVLLLAFVVALCATGIKECNDRERQNVNNALNQITSLGLNGDTCIVNDIGKPYLIERHGLLSSNSHNEIIIGFTFKNGESQYLSIPLSKIKFIEKDVGKSTAVFYLLPGFDSPFYAYGWNVSYNLQQNINYTLNRLEITLSPEAFKKL